MDDLWRTVRVSLAAMALTAAVMIGFVLVATALLVLVRAALG